MERDQVQLQSLGCFRTIKESFKIVFSWKKIFTLITLTLILPLSFIWLAQIPLSNLLCSICNTSNNQTDETKSSPPTSDPPSTSNFCKKWNSQRQKLLGLFDSIYGDILVALNLLSIAAVAYTIACIFAARQTTFKKVISVVPRVWKRLRVTYSWIFAVLFVYILVVVGVLTLLVVFLPPFDVVYVFVLGMLVYAGLLYIGSVLQLASVVSILEEKHGLEAVIKSINLMKGKMRLAVGTFILYVIFFGGVDVLFTKLVVSKWPHNLAVAIPVAILCSMLLSVINLFGLVVRTVVYFVCKSYHNEIIDKSSLSVHLEEYVGDYVGLNRSKDVRLEQSRV